MFGHEVSDLVVKIKESLHLKFKRNGSTLIYSHKMNLLDALKAVPIIFQTIDGETLALTLDLVPTPQTTHIVKGKGMPLSNYSDPLGPIKGQLERGDLIVKFDIEFPK